MEKSCQPNLCCDMISSMASDWVSRTLSRFGMVLPKTWWHGCKMATRWINERLAWILPLHLTKFVNVARLFLLEPGSFSQSSGDLVGEVNYSIDQETFPLGKQLIDRVDVPPAELADLRADLKAGSKGQGKYQKHGETTVDGRNPANQLIW